MTARRLTVRSNPPATQRRARTGSVRRVVGVFAALTAIPPVGARGARIEAVVKTVEPDALVGRIESFSLTDGLVLDLSGKRRHVPAPDLVRVTLAERDDTRGRRDATIRLQNGDLIHGRIVKSGDDSLSLDAPGVGAVDLPMDRLERIDCPHAFEPSYIESARWFQRTKETREDRVLLTNGDVLRGFVSSVDQDALSIDGPLGEARVALRLVVAVRFAGAPTKPLRGLRCVVLLRDGGRITTESLAWTGEGLSIERWGGTPVELPIDRIARLEFEGGRWAWLGDRIPISFQHTPMLSLAWDLKPNRSVAGGPIMVAGERFEHGIGVHSRSSITYDLEGTHTAFVTSFGLDDRSGPLADVTVAVRVDGQPRYHLEHVRRGTLHGPVRLDLRGAKTIELLVDFGANGALQDRFDWVGPALIR